MTEPALSGAVPDLSIGFVNGSGPGDPRSRRRAVGARPDDRVPVSPTATRRPSGPGESGAPLLGTAGWQMALTHWQRSLDTAWRANVIWLETLDALVREHMTHFQEASEQALATGRALTAAAEPEARAGLASDYLRASLDRTLASTATVMELLAQPTRQMLDLLVTPPGGEAKAATMADRAA